MKKLGFGLMRLPTLDPKDQKSIDMDQMCQMVDMFLERGFTYFDTAWMYHDHQSEIAVREALVKRHPRDAFTLTTKLPTMMLKEEGEQERIFEEQLKKCGVKYFDYYLLHNMNSRVLDTVERLDCFGFQRKLLEEGRIRHIGFSFHDKADVLDKILSAHPEVEFVQLQLNYLDWDSERVQSRLCYETAVKHGKKVIVMEPVKGGALAQLPTEAERLLKTADPSASLASWAVRFAASLPEVHVVLSGMSNVAQLQDNTGYMADFKPLTEDERAMLFKCADIINNYTAVPCTACRYCVEGCPMGIEIPEIFSLYNAHMKAKLLRSWSDPAKEKYQEFIKTHAKASDCVGCRQCEGACPQHLEVVSSLKDAAAVFETNT